MTDKHPPLTMSRFGSRTEQQQCCKPTEKKQEMTKDYKENK